MSKPIQRRNWTACASPIDLALGILCPAPAFAWSGNIISVSRSNFTGNTTSGVYVQVKNAGGTVNFAVECEDFPNGWTVFDNEYEVPPDNYLMKNVAGGATNDFGPFKVAPPATGASATLHWSLHSVDWLTWTPLDQEYQSVWALGVPGSFSLSSPAANATGVALLRGLVKLAHGAWSSSFTANARLRLLGETRRAAVRLNVILGAATAGWMFVHGWGLGGTHWSYWRSLGLLTLFVTHGIIVDGDKLRPATVARNVRPVLGPMVSLFRQFNLINRPAEAWAAVLLIASPVAANCVGAAVNRLVNL